MNCSAKKLFEQRTISALFERLIEQFRTICFWVKLPSNSSKTTQKLPTKSKTSSVCWFLGQILLYQRSLNQFRHFCFFWALRFFTSTQNLSNFSWIHKGENCSKLFEQGKIYSNNFEQNLCSNNRTIVRSNNAPKYKLNTCFAGKKSIKYLCVRCL